MEKVVYLAGDMKLQNSIMASYLEQATGIKCKIIEDVSHIPDREDGKTVVKSLILWDCGGKEQMTLPSAIAVNGGATSERDLLALFNVDRRSVIKEESLVNLVSGLFYQGDSIDQIIKGIMAIFEGELWFSRKTMTRYILHNQGQPLPSDGNSSDLLSRREREILTMVIEGATNEDIADKLCISGHTVKTHLYNIFKKIKATSRFQAVLWAAKNLMPVVLFASL